jgi:hypothetical protein
MVFPDYIPPLASSDGHDSVPWDFEYTLITVHLLKGIRPVRLQLGLIPSLKISDFNFDNRNNYTMLAPHHYLTNMNGKKHKIVPQPWINEFERSTILNIMKIPHFNRH